MNPVLAAFFAAAAAAYGVFLLFTDMVYRWPGILPAPRLHARSRRPRLRELATFLGVPWATPAHVVGGGVLVFVVGAAVGYGIFAGVIVAAVSGVALLGGVTAHLRVRARGQRESAREAWPRLIEEIRLQVVTLGRSVPRAVFEVGGGAPGHLRPAFAAANREWLITTEFDRALAVLRSSLADPTADAVCETLLTAHEIGGTEIDLRLRDLADDRSEDLRSRKDARAKQAGARFARHFVVVVPLAMALVGLQLGDGRAAFRPPAAQLVVVVAFTVIAACWLWAGALLRLPDERRVFGAGGRR